MPALHRSIAFVLRGAEGRVQITYSTNEQPSRWGWDLLGFAVDSDVARGFPVMEARVTFAAEGYAALLGWVQVVDHTVTDAAGTSETLWVAPDVAPQAREANLPYLTFGIEPVLFDSPAIWNEQNVDWTARTFLTYTPDCLMTPVVEPICGFVWGYRLTDGAVQIKSLRAGRKDDWDESRRVLRLRLPTWRFGGDAWDPPAFSA